MDGEVHLFSRISLVNGIVYAIVIGVSDTAGRGAAYRITMPADLADCHALIEQLACTVDSQHNTIHSQA